MSTRKEFLAVAPAAAILAPTIAAAATPAPKPEATLAPFHFERAKFDALAAKGVTHRNMFASRKLDGGTVLQAMNNTYTAYGAAGEQTPSLLMAAVLYHGASIVLAFDDAVWNTIIIPAIPKLTHLPKEVRDDLGNAQPHAGNPYLHAAKHPDRFDTSVEQMHALGSLFFVCNNAAMGFAGAFSHALKRDMRAVYDEMAAGLVPGAMLVPAGVWAVHALQEAKFTYLQVS